MPKGKTRMTVFSRFLLFMLITTPLSILIASLYNGEDSVETVQTIIQKGKEKIAGVSSSHQSPSSNSTNMTTSFLGLRTTIYKVPDLKEAKKWYTNAFQTTPYFDEPFYVGFNIAGFELGLQPSEQKSTATAENVLSYWGVENIQEEYERLLQLGATSHEAPSNVGGSIEVATVKDPWGNIIGLIYNPEFGYKD